MAILPGNNTRFIGTQSIRCYFCPFNSPKCLFRRPTLLLCKTVILPVFILWKLGSYVNKIANSYPRARGIFRTFKTRIRESDTSTTMKSISISRLNKYDCIMDEIGLDKLCWPLIQMDEADPLQIIYKGPIYGKIRRDRPCLCWKWRTERPRDWDVGKLRGPRPDIDDHSLIIIDLTRVSETHSSWLLYRHFSPNRRTTVYELE